MVSTFRSQAGRILFLHGSEAEMVEEQKTGELREVHAEPPPQPSVFPIHGEGRTHELVFAAEQIFLLPTPGWG